MYRSRGRESEQGWAKADELVVEPSCLPFIRSLKGRLECTASRAMGNTFKTNEFFPIFGEIGGSDFGSGLGNICFCLRPPAGDDCVFHLDVTRHSGANPGSQRISVILRYWERTVWGGKTLSDTEALEGANGDRILRRP